MMSDEAYLNAALADCEHVVGGVAVRVEYAWEFGDWTVVDLASGVVPVTQCDSPLEALMEAGFLGRGSVEAYLAKLLAERRARAGVK